MANPVLLFDDKYTLLNANIHVLDYIIGRRLNNSLAEQGTTLNQTVVLAYILKNKGMNVTQRNLESFMDLKNPSITSLVQTMVRKELIYREPNPNDKRSHYLRLTEKGLDAVDPGMRNIIEVSEKFYSILTDEDVEDLLRIFGKLIPDKNFKDQV